MLNEDISGISVVENNELVGIITKTDLIRGIQ
jgi:CBS domain-containing protein